MDVWYCMISSNQTTIHDMLFHKKPERTFTTSIRSAECYVCGRGLESGFSITAKTMPEGNALFCELHYAQQ